MRKPIIKVQPRVGGAPTLESFSFKLFHADPFATAATNDLQTKVATFLGLESIPTLKANGFAYDLNKSDDGFHQTLLKNKGLPLIGLGQARIQSSYLKSDMKLLQCIYLFREGPEIKGLTNMDNIFVMSFHNLYGLNIDVEKRQEIFSSLATRSYEFEKMTRSLTEPFSVGNLENVCASTLFEFMKNGEMAKGDVVAEETLFGQAITSLFHELVQRYLNNLKFAYSSI